MQDFIKPIKYKRLCVCDSGKESSDLGGLWFGHCLVRIDAARCASVLCFWVETAWEPHIFVWWCRHRCFEKNLGVPHSDGGRCREWHCQRNGDPCRRSKKRSNLLILLPLRMLQLCRTTQDEIRWDILPKNVGFTSGFLSIQKLSLWTGFLVGAQMSLVKRTPWRSLSRDNRGLCWFTYCTRWRAMANHQCHEFNILKWRLLAK